MRPPGPGRGVELNFSPSEKCGPWTAIGWWNRGSKSMLPYSGEPCVSSPEIQTLQRTVENEYEYSDPEEV